MRRQLVFSTPISKLLSEFPMRTANLCAILSRQVQSYSVRGPNFETNYVTFVTCKQLTLYLRKNRRIQHLFSTCTPAHATI